MFAAELILLAVLAFKVEDIDGKADIPEKGVILHCFCERAIVIEENVVWLSPRNAVSSLDHFLEGSIQCTLFH